MAIERNSKEIKIELDEARKTWKEKTEKRDELIKQLEVLNNEIKELLDVSFNGTRKGRIGILEKELHSVSKKEHVNTLPEPVYQMKAEKCENVDFRIEKVTAKRIYLISSNGGGEFYVSRDGSDSWSIRYGLDIPATIKAWEIFSVNCSSTRKK